MSLLSNIGTVQIGEENIPLKSVIQGYASLWEGRILDDSDHPISLAGAALDCEVEFMTANVTVSATSATISRFEPIEGIPRRTLVVTVDPDQSANPGEFTVAIPDDLYTAEIPPNITTRVPIAVGYFRRVTGTEKRVVRFILVFRRGITP